MMRILHSADWHLGAPLSARDEGLRRELLRVPGKVADAAKRHGCDLVLLSGDLFDGKADRQSIGAVRNALEDMAVPVFISPGNHDYVRPGSPWLTEVWPLNVHIFTENSLTSVTVPGLDCRVYGGAYTGMDCPPLLRDFRAEGHERHVVCVVHGDPLTPNAPYCPVTADQVRESGLDYLALGHIHKSGSFRSGGTLCAWPGCPMGRGFDELGQKGVLLVTLDDTVQAQFLPLNTPQFHDLQTEAGHDPAVSLEALLPPVGSHNYYRITLTGECPGVDIPALTAAYSRFPNLELRDRTTPPVDLWATAGEDTLEGVYFRLLREALKDGDGGRVRLAAKLSRKILDGQEVVLP